MKNTHETLKLKQLGIDTYKVPVVFMRKDCHICRSEGFEVPTRIKVTLGERHILATLNTIDDGILELEEASLSKYAWQLLQAKEGDDLHFSHPEHLLSLSFVRSKIYGNVLTKSEIHQIIKDIVAGRYSDIHISSFLTACSGGHLNNQEIIDLTQVMVDVGERLTWQNEMVVDKHCVGGLPGNRTTPIIVAIVASFGMMMPKTSSRAITSPAGTADTMEAMMPVTLAIPEVKKVVEKENGCIVWGGAVALSPADDILLRVARAMDLDSEGQLMASVLSKKIAAGSTHIVIDIPVGPTAKVRTPQIADMLTELFKTVAEALGIYIVVIQSDGSQPVGRGIGPALEARDVLEVLQSKKDAPQDLRDRALTLAGKILEFSPKVNPNEGKEIAKNILDSGQAWIKFKAIAKGQGGLHEPVIGGFSHCVRAEYTGYVTAIDNRQLARLAKLAGAPRDKGAGIMLHTSLEKLVNKEQALFTIYAESPGELRYAVSLLNKIPSIIQIEVKK